MKNKVEVNESVVFECRTHWCKLVIPGIVCFFFVMASFQGIFEGGEDIVFYIVFLLLSLLIFVIPFIRIKTNKLVLTNKRIFGKTGIIKTQSLSSPISKIQTVNIDRGLFGRIFGYSDITIHCITGIYIFKKQTNTEEMQNAILNVIK